MNSHFRFETQVLAAPASFADRVTDWEVTAWDYDCHPVRWGEYVNENYRVQEAQVWILDGAGDAEMVTADRLQLVALIGEDAVTKTEFYKNADENSFGDDEYDA